MLQAAVMSLGLIGAGTNNAQIAGMLRNLSSYYYKDASLLFYVMLLLNSLYFSIQYFIVAPLLLFVFWRYASKKDLGIVYVHGLIYPASPSLHGHLKC